MSTLASDIYEFIGAREFIRVDESHQHGSEEVIAYTVFLSKGNQTYKLIFDTVYHDCYSGYCGERTSNVSDFILVEEPVGTLHWVGNDIGSVRLIVIDEGGNQTDAVPLSLPHMDIALETVDGARLFTCWTYGHGGDGYYPSGTVDVNEDVLIRTNRAVDKRPIYIFQGGSKMGKSFIASHLGDELKVYETDQSETIPNDIAKYNVIVVGNRVAGQLEKVKEILASNSDYKLDIINVSFST